MGCNIREPQRRITEMLGNEFLGASDLVPIQFRLQFPYFLKTVTQLPGEEFKEFHHISDFFPRQIRGFEIGAF
jgi:hypothetical protein